MRDTKYESECRGVEKPPEIVISGLSGKFPESENLQEFQDNLYNGVDMITDDGRRWSPGLHGLPKRSGKLKELSKFDAEFFGVHPKQGHLMDPQLRILLELTHEALIDAGVNPSAVRGSNTGVFIGSSVSETETMWNHDIENANGYSLLGCQKGMLANRLSFAFDFQGPSFTIDTACSSSLLAMEQAVAAIKSGECDSAIVGGSHLCLNPEGSLQFHRLHMLSDEGKCRSFDSSGKGYVRSEAAVVIFLQKKNIAHRSYATVLNAKHSTDGYKEQGVTFPSGQRQAQLLTAVYREAGVDPTEVNYVEAHGTGTPAGDPQEVNAIAQVFCAEGRDPTRPLLLGSVKSNMGHSEPASGLCSVAKVLLSMQQGRIPANLHYKNPNPNIPALVDGRIKVVSENTPFPDHDAGGIVGINSFGFGGANVHVILKSNPNHKTPKALSYSLPLLVPFSGRNSESVEFALNHFTSHPEGVPQNPDQELISLLHKVAEQGPISGHTHRGYSILKPDGEPADMEIQEIPQYKGEETPVWFVFSGMGSQWPAMGRDLMKLPVFAQSIMNSVHTLKNHYQGGLDLTQYFGINTTNKLDNSQPINVQENIVHAFSTVVAVQIALVDVLKSLGIKPAGIIGHSVGELAAAYADGGFTAEQTILAAFARGNATQSGTRGMTPGAMAAVGLTWEEAKVRCPPGVYPACHNSNDSVTISGTADKVKIFVEQLKKEGIFAREVDSIGMAFHSKYIEPAAPIFKKSMDEIVPMPKPRSSRWISSSIPESRWKEDLAQFCSSSYHVNNVVSPVLFHAALQHIPRDSIVIEIGPHCLLQSILKRSLPNRAHLGMMNKNAEDNSIFLLKSVGKLYNLGLKPEFSALYDKIKFPLTSPKSSLSPLIKWNHSIKWDVANYDDQDNLHNNSKNNNGAGETVMEISLKKEADKFYEGHVIDGRIIFPATGYLLLIWKAFAKLQGLPFDQCPIILEQVAITRATVLPKTGNPVKFLISILKGTGEFQIVESEMVIVAGIVRSPNGSEFLPLERLEIPKKGKEEDIYKIPLSSEDAYKELRLRGYEYAGKFQGIHRMDNVKGWAEVKWQGNWVSFLDTVLQVSILNKPTRALYLPTYLDKFVINPEAFLQSLKSIPRVEESNENDDDDDDAFPFEDDAVMPKLVPVYHYDDIQVVTCEGIQFQRCQAGMAPKKGQATSTSLIIEKHQFVPYFDDDFNNGVKPFGSLVNHKDDETCLRECVGILTENTYETTIKMTEVVQDPSNSVARFVQGFVNNQPLKLFNGQLIALPSSDSSNPDPEGKGPFEDVVNSEIAVKSPEDWSTVQQIISDAAKVEDLLVLSDSHQDFLVDIASALKDNGFLLVNLRHEESTTVSTAILESLEEKSNVILVAHKKSNEAEFLLYRKVSAAEPSGHEKKSLVNGNGVATTNGVSNGVSNGTSNGASNGNGTTNGGTHHNNTVITINLKGPKDFDYGWVEEVKEAMKEAVESSSKESSRIYIVSRETPELPSGVLGLVNSLRKEPGGRGIRCFFVRHSPSDSNVPLNFYNPTPEFQKVLQRDLVMNVLDYNVWGSYRFLPLTSDKDDCYNIAQHAYINFLTRGDLSSLRYFESSLKYYENPGELCSVYYAPLNFRDVMLASGKLPLDSLPKNLGLKSCVMGLEFSGKLSNGKRVMGLVDAQAMATTVIPPSDLLWEVPSNWTLAEASTIPVAYLTAYYALVIRGKLKRGESVLIHAGAGGVGQASIAVAIGLGCKVYTTVGSQEKRDFLKKRFPQLTDASFSNSRDTSFLEHILRETKGRGVSMVLNSLAGDKLQASIKCLAKGGVFCEIGKVDLFKNSSLGMSVLLKNVTVHGILLDALVEHVDEERLELKRLLIEGIKSNVVRPLPASIFSDSDEDIEKAFRYMASGKHVGKVVLEIRKEGEMPGEKIIKAIPQTYFDPEKSYIVIGGLGGFGLELASWMIERGCKKLALVSRSGVRTGYQSLCLRKWRSEEGVAVTTPTNIDVTTAEGVSSLFKNVLSSFDGAEIGGVFNLAMVLQDGLMANQTPERFRTVSRAKVNSTLALDKVSRELAPSLEYFVVFSSLASGRGAEGLSNYAWANSGMEKVVDYRKRDGYPGLAIQWGAVGDVGVLQDDMKFGNELIVSGSLPQRILSCLATLDVLLPECKSEISSVSSMLLPEKRKKNAEEGGAGAGGKGKSSTSLVEKVAHILGMKPGEVDNVNQTKKLFELGMDSLMAVEVKQLIELNAELMLGQKDMVELSFQKIRELKVKTGANLTPENEEVEPEPIAETAPEPEPTKTNSSTDAEQQQLSSKPEISPDHDIKVDPKLTKVKADLTSCSIFSYLFSLLQILFVCILYGLSSIMRFGVNFYLKLFHNPQEIKLFDRPYDEMAAVSPRLANMVFSLRCSGVPYKSRIYQTLDQHLINWRTNISLDGSAPVPEMYKPYESLTWIIQRGLLFHYWIKDRFFNVKDHVVFEQVDLKKHGDDENGLEKEGLRLTEFYHNYKWEDGRPKPQWEFRIVAPKYDMNHPQESKEFLIIVAVHHSFGDAFSALHLLQYALCDTKLAPSSVPSLESSPEVTVEDKQNETTLSSFSVQKARHLVSDLAQRAHYLSLALARMRRDCRNYKDYCKTPDSTRYCGIKKFNLTQMKSIRHKATGKVAPLTSVVLACTGKAYEKLYSAAGKTVPEKIVALMPYNIFPYKRLGMTNNFSNDYTVVPTARMDSQDRLGAIMTAVEFGSQFENLRALWDITSLFSFFTIPFSRVCFYLMPSPSIIYTNVPATIPRSLTFFGGYHINEFFGCTGLAARSHATLASAVDSANDSVSLTLAVDESAIKISPEFLDQFFSYFQEELDSLVKGAE